MTVVLGDLSEAQRQSWVGLLEVAATLPDGWCLVGGQMVHLYCQERSFAPARPTDDGDVVLDVRAHPHVLRDFTAALVSIGFTTAGETPEGHQHRWVRDLASIDVLIPQGLGRAANRRGVTRATTLATPGAQQAISRSEAVTIEVGGTIGSVRRPNMVGALVAKAAAFSVRNDRARQRHLIDLAVLAAMARASDRLGAQLTDGDRRYLTPALSALRASRGLWVGVDGADRGLQALTALITLAPPPRGASPNPPRLEL